MPLPQTALRVAVWGVKRLARWVMFTPHILTITLPCPEFLLLVRDREAHHKLKALVVGLSMYRAEFEVSQLLGSIAAELVVVAHDKSQDVSYLGVDDLAPTVIKHVEVEINLPHQMLKGPKSVDEAHAMRVYFDGRCVNKLGAGGMIAFNHHGEKCKYMVRPGTLAKLPILTIRLRLSHCSGHCSG